MTDNRIILNDAGRAYLATIKPLDFDSLPVAEHVKPNRDGTYTCPACKYNNPPERHVCKWCGRAYLKED